VGGGAVGDGKGVRLGGGGGVAEGGLTGEGQGVCVGGKSVGGALVREGAAAISVSCATAVSPAACVICADTVAAAAVWMNPVETVGGAPGGASVCHPKGRQAARRTINSIPPVNVILLRFTISLLITR
jgi:hypothetical protein